MQSANRHGYRPYDPLDLPHLNVARISKVRVEAMVACLLMAWRRSALGKVFGTLTSLPNNASEAERNCDPDHKDIS